MSEGVANQNMSFTALCCALTVTAKSLSSFITFKQITPHVANSSTRYTQRVRSRSKDRRARPEGGSSSSVAPTTTAGSLSATADGPPEADPIRSLGDVAAATKRSTTSRLTLCGPPLGILDRFPHPTSSNYFRLTNSTSGRRPVPQTERRSTPAHEVQRFRHSAVVFAHLSGISHFPRAKI